MESVFRSRTYGSVKVGERGQLVIPVELRKALNIKSGDQLMIFAKLNRRLISLMPEKDFGQFLDKAEKIISGLERKAAQKGRR